MTNPDEGALLDWRRANCALYNDQKLKLGVFNFNCSGGLIMSEASRHEVSWDEMVHIARKADELGFEALLPGANWRGYGAKVDFMGRCYESLTLSAGLAQHTRNAVLFSTIHLPFVHPLVGTKMAATIDHASGGRFGINLTMGFRQDVQDMFGLPMNEHDDRYVHGTEWLTIAKRLWSEPDNFDFEGKFFKLKDVESNPKPIQPQRPVLVNAGVSPAGIDYTARECDFSFMPISDLGAAKDKAAGIRDKARTEYCREIGVLSYAVVICRDSEAEAKAAYEEVLELGDWEGAKNAMKALGIGSESWTEQLRDFQARFVVGNGGHVIVGTPEQVTDALVDVVNAGIDGLMLGWTDYHDEFAYFGDRVMPLLKQAGVRH
jgi:FMNH2-dependent dimethyl sulfone monooxygenase